MADKQAFSKHIWKSASAAGAGPSALARMLKDFAPRLLPDTMVEVLPPEESNASPQDETPASAGEVQTLPVEEAEFFSVRPEKMEPLVSSQAGANPVVARLELEAARRQAFAEGEEKQRFVMEEAFSARLAALEEEHLATVERVKTQVLSEAAAQFETGLRQGLREIEAALSARIADILAAFAGEKMTQAALRQFAGRMAEAACNDDEPLTVEGSRALLEALQALPEFDTRRYTVKITQSDDIRIVRGDRVVSTQLAPLMKRLKESV
ncbi:MAG: Hypothetical protein BHV28_02360 [Candidatus Tokpelaia hoelldobleri]|uniref:Uncharacterized protein n=1 Tax=Candidatus Tokpelaia hoelldobleri TaxID=1902579 RepID=A0A1U9JSW6_9HYPH|nr:MAG: Hypothetical protein BHV28_02360 [Candidatus Tokpelaia hoelldoblerii]